jgi:hypothetical protein
LPLSARVIIASLSLSFLRIEFITLASRCVVRVGFCLWSVLMWSAVSFL